jgi:DnaJ-class molecular chaperone
MNHDDGEDWVACPTCNGDRTVRDSLDLDVLCGDCGGDGGWER